VKNFASSARLEFEVIPDDGLICSACCCKAIIARSFKGCGIYNAEQRLGHAEYQIASSNGIQDEQSATCTGDGGIADPQGYLASSSQWSLNILLVLGHWAG
jgi:hypothetical protein